VIENFSTSNSAAEYFRHYWVFTGVNSVQNH
jgi:hypothetical protein